MKSSQISWRKVDAVSAEFAAAMEGVICVEYPQISWLRGGSGVDEVSADFVAARVVVG